MVTHLLDNQAGEQSQYHEIYIEGNISFTTAIVQCQFLTSTGWMDYGCRVSQFIRYLCNLLFVNFIRFYLVFLFIRSPISLRQVRGVKARIKCEKLILTMMSCRDLSSDQGSQTRKPSAFTMHYLYSTGFLGVKLVMKRLQLRAPTYTVGSRYD